MDLQRELAAHDLKLLSIGHYIHGGIMAFYSLLILLYGAFFATIFTTLGNKQESMPAGFLPVMWLILGVIFLLSGLYTLCTFLAGRWLRTHRHLLFIQVLSGLNCLFVPYGTILGVFTLVVLSRPHAKIFFSGPANQPEAIQTSTYTEPPPRSEI